MSCLHKYVGIYNAGHTHTIRRKRQGCCGGSISVLLAVGSVASNIWWRECLITIMDRLHSTSGFKTMLGSFWTIGIGLPFFFRVENIVRFQNLEVQTSGVVTCGSHFFTRLFEVLKPKITQNLV